MRWSPTSELGRPGAPPFRLKETIAAKSSAGSSNAAITGSGQVEFATSSFKVSVNAPSGGSIGVPFRLSPPPASQTADITSQVLQQAKNSSG